jgi:hypothetical protein
MALIEIGSDWSAYLQAYVQRLQSEAIAAADEAASYLHEQTVSRARQTPEWDQVADAIEVWSEDGYLVIGVRDREYASQAFTLEYGDEVRPPNPFFRVLDQDIRRAGEVMRTHMESKYGPGQIT